MPVSAPGSETMTKTAPVLLHQHLKSVKEKEKVPTKEEGREGTTWSSFVVAHSFVD